jgi:hypothetical protein
MGLNTKKWTLKTFTSLGNHVNAHKDQNCRNDFTTLKSSFLDQLQNSGEERLKVDKNSNGVGFNSFIVIRFNK